MSKIYYTKEWENKIIGACNKAPSMAKACSDLGMNHNTFISHAKRLNVYKTNQSGKGIKKPAPSRGFPLEDIIYKNKHPQYKTSSLSKRLIKEGIKKHKCEECKNTEWLGNPIPIETHHLDGDSTNHFIDNLKLLCPNCHAQTDNYKGKNKK